MKLAAIYNVFDGTELLKHSVDSVRSGVDIFIIIYQDISNFGEYYDPLPDITAALASTQHVLYRYTPDLSKTGSWNETEKRNIGLKLAHQNHCNYFSFFDCDEVYANFDKNVKQFFDSGSLGSVCPIYTYFKLPTLRFEHHDNYYVPFIHLLKGSTAAGNYEYPFYVDPTRKIKCRDVILLREPMHHFSYVRKDIGMKLRNSSAKINIDRSNILTDYDLACPGYYVKDFFGQKLIEVSNQFGIEV